MAVALAFMKRAAWSNATRAQGNFGLGLFCPGVSLGRCLGSVALERRIGGAAACCRQEQRDE